MPPYTLETYALFFSIHDKCSTEQSEQVASRDVVALNLASRPERMLGFRFYEVLSTHVEHEDRRIVLMSARINKSPIHYYGCKVYTLEEMRRLFTPGDDRVRKAEKETRQYPQITRWVKTRNGHWEALWESDAVFLESTEEIAQ